MKRNHTNEVTTITPSKKLKEDQPYTGGVIPVHQQFHPSKSNTVHPLFERERGVEHSGHDVVAIIDSIFEGRDDQSNQIETQEKEQKAISVIARFLNKLRCVPSSDFSTASKQQFQHILFENNKHIYTGLGIVARTHPELFLNEELLSGLAWLMNSTSSTSSGSLPSGQGQNNFLQLFIANIYHIIYSEIKLKHKDSFVALDPLLIKAFFYDYFYDHQWSDDKRAEGFKEDVMRSIGDDFFTKLSAEERERTVNTEMWLPPFEYRKRVGSLVGSLFEEFFQRLDAFTHIKTYANASTMIKSALSLPQICILTTRYAEGWTENPLVGPAAGEIVDRILYFVLHKGSSEEETAFARDIVRNLTFYKQKNEQVLRCLRGILKGIPGMTEFAMKELMFGICLKHMTFASKTFHVIYESAPKDENGKLITDQFVCQNLIELTETSGVSKSNICELLKFIVGSFVKSPNKLFDIMDNIKKYLVVRREPLSEAEKQKVTNSMDNAIHLCCFSIVLGYILTKLRTEKIQNNNGGTIGMTKYFVFARDIQGFILSWLVQMLPQWAKDRKIIIKYIRQILMFVKPEIIDGNILMDTEKKVGLVIFDKKSPLSFPVSEQILFATIHLIRDCSESLNALTENFKILESVIFRGLEFLRTENKVVSPSFSDPERFIQELFGLARLKDQEELFGSDTLWSCAIVATALSAIDTEALGTYAWENIPIVAVLMEMILTDNWGIRPLIFARSYGTVSEVDMEAADRAEVARVSEENIGSIPEGRVLIKYDMQQLRSPSKDVMKNTENIVTKYPAIKRRLLGRRSFFERILRGQSLERLMEWLPELIHKNGEIASALPSKLLCELLLSPRFCDPERSHCIKRIQTCATSRDNTQQSEGLDILMFFLDCLGSPHCAMRENARSALAEVFGSFEAFMRTELLTSSHQRLSEACQKIGNAINVETRPEVIAKYVNMLVNCKDVFPVQDTLMKLCLTLATRPLTRRLLFLDGENSDLLQRAVEGLITLYFSSCGDIVTREALAGISLFFGVSKKHHTDALNEDILNNLFREGGWLSMFSVRDLVLMWAESEDPVVCGAGVSKLENEDLVNIICTPGHTEQTVSLAAKNLAKWNPLAKETYSNVSRCLELYGLNNLIETLTQIE